MQSFSCKNNNSSATCLEMTKGWVLENPPTVESYEFEKLEILQVYEFYYKYWHISIYAGILYILTIFGLTRWMKNRSAYKLRIPLFLWNTSLGIFSILALVRTVPSLIIILQRENGFYMSLCVRTGINYPSVFWGFMVLVSKIVELGDTVFVILRKRPLVCLQWYHHLVTMILTWTTAPLAEPITWWHGSVNLLVHSLMYPYFALKTIGVRVPQFCATVITTLQFAQMIVGIIVNFITYYLKVYGIPCARESFSIAAFSLVYASFALLFWNLLFQTLWKKRKTARKDTKND